MAVAPVAPVALSPIEPVGGGMGGALGVGGMSGAGGLAAPTGPQSGSFQAAIGRAQAAAPPTADRAGPLSDMLGALDKVNLRAKSVSAHAMSVERSGGVLTPGEMINLTMQCQEFMFQCQLTSNIANRGSDGVQQLFKQQG